jgi:hypothetical protein
MLFAIKVGYYAKSINVIDSVIYCWTYRKESLSNITLNSERVVIRYFALLKLNQFVKEHDKSEFQYPIMGLLRKSLKFGLSPFLQCIYGLFRYKQNPFVRSRIC